jgi:hypothetical protein
VGAPCWTPAAKVLIAPAANGNVLQLVYVVLRSNVGNCILTTAVLLLVACTSDIAKDKQRTGLGQRLECCHSCSFGIS